MTTHFEDLTVDEPHDLGTFSLSAEDVVAFAEQFDPQPMHTDPEAAAEGPFDGLVASGWHTASATMRVLVDEFLSDAATLGAAGVDELRWPAPLRPDETVRVRAAVRDKRPSESSPDRGLARVEVTATTSDGTTVLRYVGIVLFARRRG